MSMTARPPTPCVPGPPTTLGSVLRQLGHQCADSCPADDPALASLSPHELVSA
ncbi:MAG: hypothetical protein M3Y71_03930 [Actinomycetota bacterium]|nr:hypothetical protein [Actinomycetota bacterium]